MRFISLAMRMIRHKIDKGLRAIWTKSVKEEICERMVRMVWMLGTVGRGQDVAIVVGWSDGSARAGIALLTISSQIYSFVHHCASLLPFVVRWSHGKVGADRILLTIYIQQEFSCNFSSH